MKLKGFKKYQSGGALPPLFSGYTPVITNSQVPNPMLQYLSQITSGVTSGTTSKATSSSGSDGMPTVKDTMALLKDMKGLDNDTHAAIESLEDQSRQAQNLAVFGKTAQSSLVSQYYRNIEMANKVSESKEEFNKAYDQAKSTGSLSEAAITSDGNVVVTDKNNQLQIITPEQYLNNSDLYNLQTNQELLYKRQHDSGMAFQNGVLGVVQNGTSFKQISETIDQIAGKLGKTSNSIEGYTTKEQGEISQGIAVLKEAANKYRGGMSMDGVYKTSLSTESSKAQAELAVDAIYRNLNQTQKSWLKLKGDGTEKGARAVIKEIVLTGVNDSQSFTMDYQQDLNSDGSKKSASSGTSKDSKYFDTGMAFFAGMGEKSLLPIQDKDNIAYSVNTYRMPLIDAEGHNLSIGTLQQVANGRYGGMIDTSQAYMGNNKLAAGGLNRVIVEGGKIYAAELPCIREDGNIRPNLQLMHQISQADKQIKAAGIDPNNITSKQQMITINKIYQQQKLPVKYDSNGNLTTDYSRFAIVNGTAMQEAFDEDNIDTKSFGTKESNDKGTRTRFQNNIRTATKDNKFTLDNGWGIGFTVGEDDLYNGLIYMPMTSDVFNAMDSSTNLTPGEAINIETLNQKRQLQLQYKKPSQSLD